MIPTEPIGSIHRPPALIDAFASVDTLEQLRTRSEGAGLVSAIIGSIR